MTTTPTTRAAAADARQRATRTFVQALVVDLVLAVIGAIAVALLPQLTDAAPATYLDTAYWAGLGTLALKTALITIVSYAARRHAAPAPLE